MSMVCKYLCVVLLVVVLSSVQNVGAFELASDDFAANGPIPAAHTCDGGNLSPNLRWSDAPHGTLSFALVCRDPDAPSGDFIHWIIYDIPASVSSLSRGCTPPAGALQLANDFDRTGYGGPCPPSGTHRYVFTLYALKTPRLGSADRVTIFKNIEHHRIGTATLTGLYARKR